MINIRNNALNEKGNLRPAVRDAIKGEVAEVVVKFKDGREAVLAPQGHGDFYGELAQCNDIAVRGNAHLAITINDYHYTAPTKKAKEPDTEPIVID